MTEDIHSRLVRTAGAVCLSTATELEASAYIKQLEADNRALMEVVRSASAAISNAGIGSAGQWTISNRSHARLSKAISALPAHLKEEASK